MGTSFTLIDNHDSDSDLNNIININNSFEEDVNLCDDEIDFDPSYL